MADINDLVELVRYVENKYYENEIYEREDFQKQIIVKDRLYEYEDNDIRNTYFQVNWIGGSVDELFAKYNPLILFQIGVNEDYTFNFYFGKNYKKDFSGYEETIYDELKTKDEIKKEIDRLVKQFLVELEV